MLPSLQEDSPRPQIRHNSEGSPVKRQVSADAFSKHNLVMPIISQTHSTVPNQHATLGLSCLSPQNQLNQGYLEVTSNDLTQSKVGLFRSYNGSEVDSDNLKDGPGGTRIGPSFGLSDMGYSDSALKKS